MKNKKTTLLVFVFLAVGFIASSCKKSEPSYGGSGNGGGGFFKDKACKCTITYQGVSATETCYPEDFGVNTCAQVEEKLEINDLSGATYTCVKI